MKDEGKVRIREHEIEVKLQMVYWKSDKFWIGKLLDHPEIMTQGETLEELEENMKDAYLLMTMDDVPEEYELKEIALTV
jgi:predicted RNase H-like HicB family nuclease